MPGLLDEAVFWGCGPAVPTLSCFVSARYPCVFLQKEGEHGELIRFGAAQEKTLLMLIIPGDRSQLKVAK